jgi:zinc and cadmium transporter
MDLVTIALLVSSVFIGAIFVEIFKPRKSDNIQYLLTFSGTYLLAITLIHLLPELFHYNTTDNIGLYILFGFIVQNLLEYFSKGIEHGHFHKKKTIPISVLISLCIHALFESLPLGSGLHQHTHNSLLTGILIHKIPVSIVLMTCFLQSKLKRKKAYFLLFLFAIMPVIGIYANSVFEFLSVFHNQIIAIVIGMILHISTIILFESTDGHKFSAQKLISITIGVIAAIMSI